MSVSNSTGLRISASPDSVVEYNQTVRLTGTGDDSFLAEGLTFEWKCSKFILKKLQSNVIPVQMRHRVKFLFPQEETADAETKHSVKVLSSAQTAFHVPLSFSNTLYP